MLDYLKDMSWTSKVLGGLLLVASISALYAWYTTGGGSSNKPYTVAPVAKEVASIPKETVATAPIKVFKKSLIVKKLDLPEDVVEDTNKQVVTVTNVVPAKGEVSVVTVENTATGEFTTYTKEKPRPLLGLVNDKRIGLGYGINQKGDQFGTVYGEYSFARVGDVYLGARAEVTTKSEGKALVILEYRP